MSRMLQIPALQDSGISPQTTENRISRYDRLVRHISLRLGTQGSRLSTWPHNGQQLGDDLRLLAEVVVKRYPGDMAPLVRICWCSPDAPPLLHLKTNLPGGFQGSDHGFFIRFSI